MKIRIKGNSLRYRLTKTDIGLLDKNGFVEETTDFTSKQFICTLKKGASENMSAEFDGSSITLFLPQEMIVELINTDKVGFKNNKGAVHLLVEKDFTCLETVEEDQSDNYPNPLATK